MESHVVVICYANARDSPDPFKNFSRIFYNWILKSVRFIPTIAPAVRYTFSCGKGGYHHPKRAAEKDSFILHFAFPWRYVMKAFIYTGGNVWKENITERPKDGDLVIAADSGLLNARKFGVEPHILLGDFDSLGEPKDLTKDTELIRVPTEKDDTETQLAVNTALERGATEIVIIGGLDGGGLRHLQRHVAVGAR